MNFRRGGHSDDSSKFVACWWIEYYISPFTENS